MTRYVINISYCYEVEAEDFNDAEEMARNELGEILGQLSPRDFGVEVLPQ